MLGTSIITVPLFLSYISISNSANILAIFTLASPSQHIWHSPLVISLANRGHNVTVLSPEGQKEPVPNLTNLPVKDAYDKVAEGYNYEDMADDSMLYWIKETFVFMEKGCMIARDSTSFQQLMEYPSDFTFDLVIMESIGVECMFGILPKFGNPPIVTVNGLSIPQWVLEATGTPANPSYVPYYYSPYDDNMKFKERLFNSIAYVYTHILYNYHYLPSADREVYEYFGPEIQSVYKTVQNVSIALSNFHPVFDTPFAIPPNLIPIAGIQIQDPKPLPDDLQNFLDEATEGAIFFSLGTNVRSDKLSFAKRKAILNAFAELPQRVLWKFESDLQDVPENVKISKWLPQNDILAHPNIKVFITHSGLLSTHETIARGVPVVGIPFIVDQHTNIRKLVKFGCGVQLEYKFLTKDTLLRAVKEVIENPRYKENMKTLSEKFQDNPQTPLERAVFWVEYVLRHKGATHFQSGVKKLNFIQFYLLDVVVFLIVVPTVIISMIRSIFFRGKSKSKKQKQK